MYQLCPPTVRTLMQEKNIQHLKEIFRWPIRSLFLRTVIPLGHLEIAIAAS
jgi:hypothetical protein